MRGIDVPAVSLRLDEEKLTVDEHSAVHAPISRISAISTNGVAAAGVCVKQKLFEYEWLEGAEICKLLRAVFDLIQDG
nr:MULTISPECIES: hypothetical protein [Achromobacter]